MCCLKVSIHVISDKSYLLCSFVAQMDLDINKDTILCSIDWSATPWRGATEVQGIIYIVIPFCIYQCI